jgi:hypothetical protein
LTTGNGPTVAGPAATVNASAVSSLPARSARMWARPRCVVLKRSVTSNPNSPGLTIGRPRERRTALPAGPPALENVADTVFAPSSVTAHVREAPEQPPPQRRKIAPAAGTAVSCTLVTLGYGWVHVRGGPLLAHVPPVADTVPRPATFSVSISVCPDGVAETKVAVTFRAALIVTAHVFASPEQAPPQPSNVQPDEGVAVSVTFVFTVRLAVQTDAPAPQLIPPPVTVPVPVTLTVSGTVELPPPEKLAVTDLALLIVSWQVELDPEQAPPQPRTPAPDSGTAVNVTDDPVGSLCVHTDPPAEVHAIPPPVTVPLPVTETLNVCVAALFAKVPWTVRPAVPMETVQLIAVPEQAPLQPVKS